MGEETGCWHLRFEGAVSVVKTRGGMRGSTLRARPAAMKPHFIPWATPPLLFRFGLPGIIAQASQSSADTFSRPLAWEGKPTHFSDHTYSIQVSNRLVVATPFDSLHRS